MIKRLFLTSSYQIGYISFSVSFNLPVVNLFKPRDDVYLYTYTMIRFGVLLKIERHRFQIQKKGKIYTECKYHNIIDMKS